MLLWGMIDEDDITIDEQIKQDVCNVLETIESNSVSMDNGMRPLDRAHSENSLQKVRKTRSGFEKSEEMGTAA